MTGYDLLGKFAPAPELSQTPFIMITAEVKDRERHCREKAGVSNYIVKPFNAATLKTKMEAVFPGAAEIGYANDIGSHFDAISNWQRRSAAALSGAGRTDISIPLLNIFVDERRGANLDRRDSRTVGRTNAALHPLDYSVAHRVEAPDVRTWRDPHRSRVTVLLRLQHFIHG